MKSDKPKFVSAAAAGSDDADAARPAGADRSAPHRPAPVTTNSSGRVKFDDRGNAVWEWAISTGLFDTEVSTKRLRKLENSTLALEDDPAASPAAPPATAIVQDNPRGITQGYSPYDSGVLVKAAEKGKGTIKKDLRRLSEWVKLREQFNGRKNTEK